MNYPPGTNTTVSDKVSDRKRKRDTQNVEDKLGVTSDDTDIKTIKKLNDEKAS